MLASVVFCVEAEMDLICDLGVWMGPRFRQYLWWFFSFASAISWLLLVFVVFGVVFFEEAEMDWICALGV